MEIAGLIDFFCIVKKYNSTTTKLFTKKNNGGLFKSPANIANCRGKNSILSTNQPLLNIAFV